MPKYDAGKRYWNRSLLLTICFAMVVVSGLRSRMVPTSYGYAADASCRLTGLQNHSTFHYEFTRVLAAAAGFNETDAEKIAVADEATDTGDFTGYAIQGGAISAVFDNTQRIGGGATLWYHMARRSKGYPIVTQPDGQSYPQALANTCGYFTKPFTKPIKTPCRDSTGKIDPTKGELDQLREWAINGVPLPSGKGPTVATGSDIPNDGGNVSGRNVYALGIYLHAVADSYSHEKCMMHRHIRAHVPQPYECKGIWHVTSEFGDYQDLNATVKGAGVPFTLTAARALWQEILNYRAANGQGSAFWDENKFMEFAKAFISTKTAALRVEKAVTAFNQLTGETAIRQACTTSNSGRRSPMQ